MVETVHEVRALQHQVARFLEAMTRLTVRVEALEAAIKPTSREA